MKKLLIAIIVIIIIGLGYYFTQRQNAIAPTTEVSTHTKTYSNDTGGYQFDYPSEWEAVTSKFDDSSVLFGPGATNESGTGGVEFMALFASNKTLAAFVKEFNAGVESGSTSETETTINGQRVIVSILPGPGDRETKSVAFQNGNQVFNVYIGYSPSDDTDALLAGFDTITSTLRFTSPQEQTTSVTNPFNSPNHNALTIEHQKLSDVQNVGLLAKNVYFEKPGFLIISDIEKDTPNNVIPHDLGLFNPGRVYENVAITLPIRAGTYFAQLYEDDGDQVFDKQKDKILPLYDAQYSRYDERFVVQFVVIE